MGTLLPKTDKDFRALLDAKLPALSSQDDKQTKAQAPGKTKLPVLRGGVA